jgi:broad specificity phosphatase PhoE
MKQIILIRHGESQSNINKELYFEKDLYDHLIELSPKGVKQSKQCGKELSKILGKDPYSVFVSSYLRALQTWDNIFLGLKTEPNSITVDGRIREQEFKDFKSAEDWAEKRERVKKRGKLSYRYKNAESGNDVIDRVTGFYNQLRMDIFLGNTPDTIVIVCHEIVIRCFLIIALGINPERFSSIHIENCEILTLSSFGKNLKFEGRYK